MSSHIVYSNVNRGKDVTDADDHEDNNNNNNNESLTLFAGQKLWFSHSVPQRKWLIENARANGAVIVNVDTNADIKLVDHTRKNQPVGAYSYRYVELSIRRGQLENLADHAVGVATRVARPVGSTTTAPKGSRVPYTEEDDQFLWNWMKPFEDSGGAYKGNEIYKQIEQVNPRHTYQSWRDRWLKATRFQKRQVTKRAEPEQQERYSLPEEEPRPALILPDSPGHRPEPDRSTRTALLPRKRKLVTVQDDAASEEQPRQSSEAPRRLASPELHTTAISIGRARPSSNRDDAAAQNDVLDNEQSQRSGRNGSTQDHLEDEELHTENEKRFLDDIRGPFSKADSLPLYRLVPKLSHMGLEEFDDVWRQMVSSEDYKHHTAKQWKHWFEYRVLPDYCRIEQVAMDQIAPYMSIQEENTSSGGDNDDNDGEDDQPADGDAGMNKYQDQDSDEDPSRCANCYTMDARKWHRDTKGRLLCNPCAVFLRTHGVPRPSTMGLVNQNAPEDDRTPDPSGLQTPSRTSPQKLSITPIVASIKVSPKIFPADVSNFAGDESKTLRLQRDMRSPSFQPESPTLIRAPGPNEARKRSTGPGRGSQSQSTQSTNGTSNQSNTQSFSQIHGLSIDETQQEKVQTNSEEHTRRKDGRPTNTAPSFSFITSSNRDRPRLHDGPDNLDIQQNSSLSTDRGPPRDPPVVHSSTETDVILNSPPLPPRSNSRDSPLPLPEGFSRLFVAQDDNGDEELEVMGGLSTLREEEEAISEGGNDDGMTSPLRVSLIGDEEQFSPTKSEPYHEVREESDDEMERSSPYGAPGHEDSQRDALGSYHTGRDTMEEYETAPEQPRKRKKPSRRLSTPALFGQTDIDEDVSAYLEVVEPEGGWDSILGPDPAADVGGGGAADEASTGGTELLDDDDDGGGDGGAAYRRDLENDVRPGEFLIDTWCRRQKGRIPNVPDAFLLQAAHCTTQEYGPKTEQMVEYFLDRWRRKRQRVSADRFGRRRPSKTDLEPPSNVPGVWTDGDDESLKSADAGQRRRVVDKHGQDACARRLRYLKEFEV